jgi:hypothetical protein
MEATYIKETLKKVRNLSFEEKKALYDEKNLDAIIEFKTLSVKTSKIENLIENIEQITWFNDLDNESLMLINDLISSIRDLHLSLARQYASFIRLKGIAKKEIKNFKSATDDLKDIANDLDSRFFFLPNSDVFQQTSKELSLL